MNRKDKKVVSRYFERDLYKAVEEMDRNEMVSQIREVEDTRYWIAITKYIEERMVVAQGSLCVMDPHKSPTEIARAQGILSGLMDLHDMVSKMKQSEKDANKKSQDKRDGIPSDDYSPGYGI